MAKRNFVPAHGAKLLRKVAKHILAEPLRYEQDAILSRGKPGELFDSDHPFPACGTIACIGGWVAALTQKRLPKYGASVLSTRKLRRLLGVDGDSICRLIAYTHADEDDDRWPQKFLDAYEKAETPAQKARIGAARIEHFIKTGL